ncbi:lysylphosphatidylglycerol synthase transmembrane domain-containing protein [Azospirillum halopraeferens]|uniref:lysylphosphatidylglycerol synthase transmembrane domain-containing protein n=1 Tax=Azospirillum halopraeferens TaxID=34010 RepID=UPI0004196654|nr:lysylphosphatidylglycerol synthase transmembrane domain-containing protein [Azospirillum halopraeferens]
MPAFSRSSLRRAEHLTVLAVALTLGAFAAAGVATGWREVTAHLARLDAAVVAGLLALSLANYAARALRWRLFEGRLGIRVPPGHSALFFTAGFALTTTPGKVGEALRLWLLERRHAIPYARSAPLLIGDRIGDANAVMALCLLSLVGFAAYAWLSLVFLAALVVANAMLLKPALFDRAIGLGFQLAGRGARLFAGLRTALRRNALLYAPRLFAAALVLSMAGWAAESLAFHWLLATLGADVAPAQSVFIFAFAMLVGAASMLPGGLGGTEATMMGLLLAVGVDADVALAATAVIRLTTLWFAVLLGFLALPAALRVAGRPAAGRPGERSITA